jgi:hypothetical protein
LPARGRLLAGFSFGWRKTEKINAQTQSTQRFAGNEKERTGRSPLAVSRSKSANRVPRVRQEVPFGCKNGI